MNPLTPYEREQVQHIAGWKAESPLLVVELFEKLTHPLVRVAKQFLPEKAVGDAIQAAYKASEVFAHREDVIRRADVKDIRELRRASLQRCDDLADEFAKRAGEGAMMRGAVISGAGGAGAILGMEVMVTYALKTIHTVGFCYGFCPEDPRERDFALSVLLIAAAGSLEEKQHAMSESDRIKEFVAGEIVEDLAKDAVESMAEEALQGVAQQAAEDFLSERLLESGALRAIPFLGVVVGAISDAAVAQYIGRVAKYSFQERWLAVRGKVRQIAADESQVRTRFQRTEGVLAAGLYWTTFLTSFVVSFPPLFIAGLLPAGNAAERGLSAGKAAAVRDAKALRRQLKHVLSPAPADSPASAAGAAATG
ncbi:MAG: EcsC family protein [Pirellulales bacterium]